MNNHHNDYHKDRKAQISHFLILGIVILAAVIFTYVVKEQRYERLGEEGVERIGAVVPLKARPIADFIENCIKKEGEPVIKLLALQGGHLNFSNVEFAETAYSTISYVLIDGEILLASKSQIEQELGEALNARLQGCVGDLGQLRLQWGQVFVGSPKTNASIRQNDVVFRVSYPITLIDKDGTEQLSSFGVAIPLRLGMVHSAVQNITAAFARHPDWIDGTLLSDVSTAEITVALRPENSTTYIVSVSDSGVKPPLVFLAAFRTQKNSVPKITNLEEQYTLLEEQPFQLQVNAEDDHGVVFADDTPLFDITQGGLISFIPHVPGTYTVRITATDAQQEFDEREVTFIVTEAEG